MKQESIFPSAQGARWGMDEEEFLDREYPMFKAGMLVPIIAAALVVIAMVLVGLWGDAPREGMIVFWVATAGMEAIFLSGLLLQLLSRHHVRRNVFYIDTVNAIAYRYGRGLNKLDRRRADEIIDRLRAKNSVMSAALQFEIRFPNEQKGEWWSPLTFVTFRREGGVTATVGRVRRVVRGVARGRWTEVSIILNDDGRGVNRETSIRLIIHELAHVPISRMFPRLSTEGHHNLMSEMGLC